MTTEPLEIKMTGKNGEVEFHLFVKGNEKEMKKVIKFLQEYLKLKKLHQKTKK